MTALDPQLDRTLYNYWGLRVSGSPGHLILSNGKDSLSLMTDKPGSILARFGDDKEGISLATSFLAGVWFGHRAEPITHAGVTAVVVVV